MSIHIFYNIFILDIKYEFIKIDKNIKKYIKQKII